MGNEESKTARNEDDPPTVTVGLQDEPTHGEQQGFEYLLETPSIEVVRDDVVSMDDLKAYFSSKKSHGGRITSITEDDDCYVVTFANMKDAQQVLSHPHELNGTRLQVHYRKNPTIEVITDGTIDEERLRVYFTNTHASGGGPIERIKKDSNDVPCTTVQHKHVFYITFQHKIAAVNVVRRPSHFIEEKQVAVSEKLSLIDPQTLLIKGIPRGCTNGFLRDYLEGLGSAQNKVSVTAIIRSVDETIAVVSLRHHIDGKTRRLMADELKRNPLSGKVISVSQLVVTRSVQLSGITKRLTQDELLKYFENTEKSRGGKILDIITDEQQGRAIIRFQDPMVVQRVVSKPVHEFGFGPISASAYYEELGTITEVDNTTSSTTPTDKTTIHKSIKLAKQTIKNVDSCKLRLLEKQLKTVQSTFPNVDFDIIPDSQMVSITGVEREVQQAQDRIKAKLDEFEERRWQISTELQSVLLRQDTKKTINGALTQANVLNDVTGALRNEEFAIWAIDEATASIAENSVRALFTEKRKEVSKEVLEVGGWNSFMAQSNEDANFSAVMSADKSSGKVKIVGLVQAVDDMEKKLDDFFYTSEVNVDEAVLNFLLKGQKDQIQKIAIENEVKIDSVKTSFKILGPRERMNKVSEALMELASTVIKSRDQYKKPGLTELFRKDEFQKKLKKIEENHRCIIQWNYHLQASATKRKHPRTLPHASTLSVGHLSIGPITIDIQPGQLEYVSTDVIVNPVTSSKAFTMVGDALVQEGGKSIRDNFRANWGSRVNGVLLTDAGTLRCKRVAHMMLPKADKVKDAVYQCLVISNQAGMRSIAFPAIGTGGLRLTPSQSARAIRAGVEQFVRQNPTPVLTVLRLTIFHQRMVAAYMAEFCSIPREPVFCSISKEPGPATTGNITTPTPGQQEMNFGLVKMQVQQGNICQETTDVIVGTVLKDMGFTVVTKAIVKEGGQSIADDLKKAWPKRTENVVFTDAGKLPSKKIAHMILPSASELKDSVLACLEKADKLGMKSISLPAIGTGGVMSQAESARGIYSGVQEFDLKQHPQNLKLVRVIIYDIKMLGTFHLTLHQFSSGGHVTASPPTSPGLFGSVDVQIQQGDLAKETTDAVVNPVNTDGGFFAVGQALEKAGGAKVRTDCQKSWEKRVNDVLLKDGACGTLKCKKIIHMACPDARSMKGRVLECLQQAERDGLTSVAFPAIGTGGFGVSAADAARETVQAIKDFAMTHNPRSVQLVRVTVFQASMVAAFHQAVLLNAPIASRDGAAAAVMTTVVPPFGTMQSNADVEQVVEVTFLACNQLGMDNAKSEVSETIDSYMRRAESTIRRLDQTDKDAIIQMGTEQLVRVTITGNDIKLEGLTDDVEVVIEEIGRFLQEKTAAYDADELKVPDDWDTPPSGTTGAHIVSLQQTSPEYMKVEQNFLASVGYNPQIVSISRVQNEAKYKAYMLELKEREKRLGKSAIEKVLYHGTAHDVVDNINQGGFNRSYCGKNATVYGKGMYFARNASYSAQAKYSPPDSQGNKYVYQARVIVGEYTTGKRNIVEPPPKNPSNAAVRYDSVVDNVDDPRIFVVFRDNEAYPEYLIVFK
ncbi:protein mono-ADP-ribosyltransferase PARP14-like [Branchiostoma floridae x Branchiostoma japonicum]